MMKVILTQDVEHLGSSGSIQTVRDGFARNYLLPQKLAILATPGALKQAEERQAAMQRRVAKQEAAMQGLADRIQGQVVRFYARVGREGRLFGSITAGDIATKLTSQVGEEIDRRRVALTDPIRSIGEHTVHVHLVGRLNPAITVFVENEGGDEADEDEVPSTEPADAVDTADA
jgi:large subunit ribosomal protein L9